MAESPNFLLNTIQFGQCGLGYGVDTTFHRTYVQFCMKYGTSDMDRLL